MNSEIEIEIPAELAQEVDLSLHAPAALESGGELVREFAFIVEAPIIKQ